MRQNQYPDFEVSAFPEADTPSRSLQEITSVADLDKQLAIRGADPTTLTSEVVQESRHNLVTRTQETGKRLFLSEINGANWAIVADSEYDISQTEQSIDNIAALQARIDPNNLYGMCIYVHEFASGLGISDGNVNRDYSSNHEGSIYPVLGIHEMGYVDVESVGKTVYFDLTSKVYAFADVDADKAVLEGLIVVEDMGRSDVISNIYQAGWDREPFQPDQSHLDYTIENGNNRFLSNQ